MSAAIESALASMPARALALVERLRKQDEARGWGPQEPYLWTGKVDDGARLGELRARLEEPRRIGGGNE